MISICELKRGQGGDCFRVQSPEVAILFGILYERSARGYFMVVGKSLGGIRVLLHSGLMIVLPSPLFGSRVGRGLIM